MSATVSSQYYTKAALLDSQENIKQTTWKMCHASWYLFTTTLNTRQNCLCCPSPFSALLNLNLTKGSHSDPTTRHTHCNGDRVKGGKNVLDMRGGMHVLRGVVGERQGTDKPVGGEKGWWMQGVQEGGGKERKLCGHDQMEGRGVKRGGQTEVWHT